MKPLTFNWWVSLQKWSVKFVVIDIFNSISFDIFTTGQDFVPFFIIWAKLFNYFSLLLLDCNLFKFYS